MKPKAFSGACLRIELGQDRHDGERHAERDEQGDEHRRGERREHLALDPLKREERHQDDGDDEDRERHRPCHLHERLGNDAALLLCFAAMREVATDVLDDDHGRVDDHADGEGHPAQAHQVQRQPRRAHDHEADEKGERQRQRDDQRGPKLGQEQEQDQDDEDAALAQRVRDRLDAGLDERGAVVEDVDPHALGQGGADLRHRLLDPAHHVLRVLALEHDDHAGHDLALAVARDRALAGLGADGHVGDVAQVHRRAVLGLEHDALDVGDVLEQPDAAQVDLLPAAHDHPATGVGVVALDGLDHVVRGQAVLEQLVGRDEHLVLLDVAAEAVDLVHARRSA